jgi:hypothetical protein
MNGKVRRTGMNESQTCRPLGPQLFLLGNSHPDLTVGVLPIGPFGPVLISRTRKLIKSTLHLFT